MQKQSMEYLTTTQSAKMLKLDPSRIRQFILEGRLPAQKIGRDLFIKEQYLLNFKSIKRLHGRPKGVENENKND